MAQTWQTLLFPLSLLAALSALSSCSGGGGGAPTGESPATSTGVFLDSPVVGLTYRSGSRAPGTTDAAGTFVYTRGESLTFSVGGVELGTLASGADVVTPFDFGAAALNIARFLQSLDADGDASNGIDITAAAARLQSTTRGSALFTLDSSAFENDIAPVLDIALGSGAVLIDAATAMEHLVANVPDGTGSGGTYVITLKFEYEVEPNDSTSTANPIALPSLPSGPDDRIGFTAFGAIESLLDSVDSYSFTAARTRTYVFKLCPSACNLSTQDGSLDVGIAYFSVLDQFGNVLLSTQGDEIGGNFGELTIDAGVLYYVTVIAEDTADGPQAYWQHALERRL